MYARDRPDTRAAAMYSSSRTGSVAERTIRISPGASEHAERDHRREHACGKTASTTSTMMIAGIENAGRRASVAAGRAGRRGSRRRGRAARRAIRHDDQRLDDADHRHPRADEQPVEHVAAERVGAEQVLAARSLVHVRAGRRPARRDVGQHDRREDRESATTRRDRRGRRPRAGGAAAGAGSAATRHRRRARLAVDAPRPPRRRCSSMSALAG